MKVDTLVLGPVMTNCYIVSIGDECIIIDPADRADRIVDHLTAHNLKCKAILLTHGHFDHISAVDPLCQALGVDFYLHNADLEMIRNSSYNASYYFGCAVTVESCPKSFYGDTVLDLGDFEIEVFHTPGHSKGSVCYRINDCLFCGDLLFKESCGRTDLYGGDVKELILSISRVLKRFDDNITVYSGHDDCFTLEEAKRNNYVIVNYKLG